MIKRAHGKMFDINERGSLISCPIVPDGSFTAIEVIFYDGRSIEPIQRKKIYALIRDIGEWSGYLPEEAKAVLKWHYRCSSGAVDFSLSDCPKDIATGFISFLIEFCLINDVPCRDSLPELCEDIERYLYLCLIHKKCCICGKKTQLHHVDTVGMGYDRREPIHIGKRAEALCYLHHRECHSIGQKEFDGKYHIFGVVIDGIIADKYKLKK